MLRKKRLDNINRCRRIIAKIQSSSMILKTSWECRGRGKPFQFEKKKTLTGITTIELTVKIKYFFLNLTNWEFLFL